ncbi:hypothetical protein DRP77_01100 [Candidatus Poribacteria bacterium]|nr:MAG: hypothetical protein DRP77_01100 [Candidatus Poribacteria bacterium]
MSNAEVLIQINHWWARGDVRPELLEKVERAVFPHILEALGERQIVLIQGPRRTGKTSLMFQLIHHLIRSGVDPRRILYASMDDPLLDKSSLFQDIIDLFETTLLGQPLLESSEKLYLFLDEIAHFEGWELMVKRFYDQRYPFKFILSSSSSAFLESRSKESLVGRAIVFHLLPFSFSEYAQLKGKERIRKWREILEPLWTRFFLEGDADRLIKGLREVDREQRLMGREIELILREYLYEGGFPEFLQLRSPLLRSRYFWENVVERVLYHDIPEIFRVEDRELLQRIFIYCVSHSGSIVNIVELGRDFGAPRQTISNYLNYLKSSLLIRPLVRYARTAAGRLRGFKKVYACDSGLMVHLQRLTREQVESRGLWGVLAEIAVLAQLQRYHPHAHIYYYRERDREVDFVIELNGRLIPLEVKYRREVEIPNGLRLFKRRFKTEFEILITKDQLLTSGTVLFVPLRLFLC